MAFKYNRNPDVHAAIAAAIDRYEEAEREANRNALEAWDRNTRSNPFNAAENFDAHVKEAEVVEARNALGEAMQAVPCTMARKGSLLYRIFKRTSDDGEELWLLSVIDFEKESHGFIILPEGVTSSSEG